MAKLKETNAQFDDLKADLSKTLDEIGEKIQEGRIDTALGADMGAQSDDLKSIVDEIEGQKAKLDELNTVGEDILTILDALDCKDTPKGRAIEGTMQSLQTKYAGLQQAVQAKQKKLDDKVFQSLQQWVTKNKKVFNDMKPVSLDRDTLNEQIQNQRDITAEIESRQVEINSIKSRYQDKPATPGNVKKYKTLAENVNTLSVKAKERGASLEGVVQKLEPFHLAVYQLESWHSYAAHSLKQESMDVEFLFTKIDNVYKQREEKREHLNSVKEIGQELVDDANFGDKDKLETLLEEMQNKWTEIEQNLVKLISTAAERKIETFSKSLEKIGKDLEGAAVPSPDAEEVTKQYTDHQASHTELKKMHKRAVDAVAKCKTMYKDLSGEEPVDIQAKWVVVQKEFMGVSKKSEERLGVLEEAQPAQLSADIEMDEILQEWIEVDTVEGEGNKKKKADAAKDTGSKKKSTSGEKKTSSTPKTSSASKKKSESKKTDAGKDHGEKKKEEDSKKDKKKDEESKKEKKKDEDSKKEKKKDEESKKDKKKDEEAKKEEKKEDKKEEEKIEEKAEAKEDSKQKEDDKKEESKKEDKETEKKTETKDDKEKEKKSSEKKDESKSKSSSSKSSSKSKSSSSSADKGFVVKLHAGNRSEVTLRNGIVLYDMAKETKFPEVMDFVRPHIPKIGLVKFFFQKAGSEHVFVSMGNQKEVARCVQKLNGTTLHGQKIKVKKANVQFLDRAYRNVKSSRSRKSESDEELSTIFDTPQNGKEQAKDEKKKGVLTLEEIKKGKRDELVRQMRIKRERRLAKEGSSGTNLNTDRPQTSSSGTVIRKRKTVLTLTELRARNARNRPTHRDGGDRRVAPRRDSPPRLELIRRGDRDDRRLPDSKELDRERQRVRLEQERLERERLQAERERVALERERQKRELDRIMFADASRRAVKRSLSPGFGHLSQQHHHNGPPRNDGTYWMQPKRPALDRQPSHGNDLRQERRQINTAFNDRTLSHLRFDDMRPLPMQPPPVPPLNTVHRPPDMPLRRPEVTGNRPGPALPAQVQAHRETGMPIQRVQQRWNNRPGGPSWM